MIKKRFYILEQVEKLNPGSIIDFIPEVFVVVFVL